MASVTGRLERLEARLGPDVSDELYVDSSIHWSCYVRNGHADEDFADACRRAGLPTELPGLVLLGEIPAAQVPPDFVPTIQRIQIGGPPLVGN